jgi:hypothetical protein
MGWHTTAVGMLLYIIFGCSKCLGKKVEKKFAEQTKKGAWLKSSLCGLRNEPQHFGPLFLSK